MSCQGAEADTGKVRQRRSIAEKQQIVELTFAEGASVAAIARARGINANLIFGWRRLYKSGQLVERKLPTVRHSTPRLLPVSVAEEAPHSVAVESAAVSGCAAPGTIHVRFAKAQVRVEGMVDAVTLRAVLECLRG